MKKIVISLFIITCFIVSSVQAIDYSDFDSWKDNFYVEYMMWDFEQEKDLSFFTGLNNDTNITWEVTDPLNGFGSMNVSGNTGYKRAEAYFYDGDINNVSFMVKPVMKNDLDLQVIEFVDNSEEDDFSFSISFQRDADKVDIGFQVKKNVSGTITHLYNSVLIDDDWANQTYNITFDVDLEGNHIDYLSINGTKYCEDYLLYGDLEDIYKIYIHTVDVVELDSYVIIDDVDISEFVGVGGIYNYHQCVSRYGSGSYNNDDIIGAHTLMIPDAVVMEQRLDYPITGTIDKFYLPVNDYFNNDPDEYKHIALIINGQYCENATIIQPKDYGYQLYWDLEAEQKEVYIANGEVLIEIGSLNPLYELGTGESIYLPLFRTDFYEDQDSDGDVDARFSKQITNINHQYDGTPMVDSNDGPVEFYYDFNYKTTSGDDTDPDAEVDYVSFSYSTPSIPYNGTIRVDVELIGDPGCYVMWRFTNTATSVDYGNWMDSGDPPHQHQIPTCNYDMPPGTYTIEYMTSGADPSSTLWTENFVIESQSVGQWRMVTYIPYVEQTTSPKFSIYGDSGYEYLLELKQGNVTKWTDSGTATNQIIEYDLTGQFVVEDLDPIFVYLYNASASTTTYEEYIMISVIPHDTGLIEINNPKPDEYFKTPRTIIIDTFVGPYYMNSQEVWLIVERMDSPHDASYRLTEYQITHAPQQISMYHEKGKYKIYFMSGNNGQYKIENSPEIEYYVGYLKSDFYEDTDSQWITDEEINIFIALGICLIIGGVIGFVCESGIAGLGTITGLAVFFSIPGSSFSLLPISFGFIAGFILVLLLMNQLR